LSVGGGQSYLALGVMETPNKIPKNAHCGELSPILRFVMAQEGSFGPMVHFLMLESGLLKWGILARILALDVC